MKKVISLLMGLLVVSFLMFFVLSAEAQMWPQAPRGRGGMPGFGMPGPFPGGPPPTQLVVEDVDGDGKTKEIILFIGGKLHVITTIGTEMQGFPVDLRPSPPEKETPQ